MRPEVNYDLIILSNNDLLSSNYTCQNLFSLDNQIWESVSQYIKEKGMNKSGKATRAKINQNTLIQKRLQNTQEKVIITNYLDPMYSGNKLGNTLMEIRDNCKQDVKCNCLKLKDYSKEYFTISGDPTPEIETKIKELGGYKKNGRKITKKIKNINGWYIPKNKNDELEEILIETDPETISIQKQIKKMIKDYCTNLLEICEKFRDFKQSETISPIDLHFVVNDYLKQPKLLVKTNKKIPKDFNEMVKQSPSVTGLLWSIINNKFEKITFDNYEIDTAVDVEVTNFIDLFSGIYSNIKSIEGVKSNPCLFTHKLLLPEHDSIREEYFNRSKLKKDLPQDTSQAEFFKQRFEIDLDIEHIEKILEKINNTSNKCKLLILISIEQLNKLSNN